MGSQPPTQADSKELPEPASVSLAVGSGESRRDVAILDRKGRAPGLFWLGGFGSDMRGAKATALDSLAATAGLAMVRFDYSGHGASSGRFEEGTITRWLEEARAVFNHSATRPSILVGSSMGGWIALLLTASLRHTGDLAGLVLVAPAVDMTRDLMWQQMDDVARARLMTAGAVPIPASGLPITRTLIEDGDQHLFGERLIEVGCPITILQGIRDTEVPYQHAERLVSRLASDDVVLTLIKDGDHRLSRPEDLELLTASVTRMVADFDAFPKAP